MQRLTGMDATFLYTETPASHMHVTGVSVFDPTTVPGGYEFEKVKALVENRLQLLPPFRRRLAEIPFQLHHPLWIEDPDFDLDYHIRRAALPAPGGDKELAEFTAEVNSRPLDRSRPLWEMYVIEGLENGLIATVTKTHHAAIDGVSGAELTVNLLDLEPEPAVLPPAGPAVGARPHPVRRRTRRLRAVVAGAPAARRGQGRPAHRRDGASALRRRNREPGVTPPPAPFSAPRTSLNVTITPRRRVAFTEVSLDDVKMVKNALGGTVNDVVLAMCSGALRRCLEDRDEQPDGPLVAMVPISVRTDDQKGAMGNRVSSMFVNLATDVDDPVKRLHAIQRGHQGRQGAGEGVRRRGPHRLDRVRGARRRRPGRPAAVEHADLRPGAARSSMSRSPTCPGPTSRCTRPAPAWSPCTPSARSSTAARSNITCMSYMGSMYFGLNADHDAVPDVDDIASYINDALGELMKAANSGSKKKAPASKR